NREAQNALLKTLEEPPGHAVLMLITAQPHLLLPTVRSRCFAVPLTAMPTTALADLLVRRGFARDEAMRRSALAAGRPGHALHLDLPSLERRRGEVLDMLDSLSAGPHATAGLAAHAASLAGNDEATLDAGLDLLLTLLRDALRVLAPGATETLVHADLRRELERVGGRLG